MEVVIIFIRKVAQHNFQRIYSIHNAQTAVTCKFLLNHKHLLEIKASNTAVVVIRDYFFTERYV